MTPPWLPPLSNTLGDRNPQLLREWKSRLQPRGIAAALGLSVLGQVLLIAGFWLILIGDGRAYCSGGSINVEQCFVDGQRVWALVDWQAWWIDILRVLNQALPTILLGFGMYQLISDLQSEEQRGTLNFIRLSPRRSRSIFLGKLLGVPTLLYIAIALVLPLHLVAMIGASVPLGFPVSYYGLLLLDAILLFTLAMVVGILGTKEGRSGNKSLFANSLPITVPLVIVLFIFPQTLLPRLLTVWQPYQTYLWNSWGIGQAVSWNWFGLPLANWFVGHGLQILLLGTLAFWLWQMLHRAYQQPSATPLSKRQSYGLSASLFILTLGFFVPLYRSVNPNIAILGLVLMVAQTWVVFAVLSFTLLPDRQALLDWSHSRRLEGATRPSRIADWLLGAQSPGVAAIAVNVSLMLLLTALWVLLLPPRLGQMFQASSTQPGTLGQVLCSLGITALMMVLYATLAQRMLLLKTPKRVTWAKSAVALTAGIPILWGGFLEITTSGGLASQLCFLFSPIPWVMLGSDFTLPLSGVLAVMGLQALLIALLGRELLKSLSAAPRAPQSSSIPAD